MGEAVISPLAFLGIFHMPLEFITEMPDRRSYGPCGGISQRANGIPFNLSLYIPKQINITQFAFTIFNILQNLLHPSRPLTTGRTLPATLVTIKPRQRQCMSHHALVLVKHNK